MMTVIDVRVKCWDISELSFYLWLDLQKKIYTSYTCICHKLYMQRIEKKVYQNNYYNKTFACSNKRTINNFENE